MRFLNPLMLFFLASVPALVLLYFLKLKRPQVTVPSTLLWQKVIEDMRVNSPFQKLKKSLLLLLQLLVLLALIFSLARPLMVATDTTSSSIIVLIDRSASMLAKEPGGKRRIDMAKKAASELADSLAKDAEMMLITFDSRAKMVMGFSNNKRLLKDKIAAIQACECSTDITTALMLARSIANSRNHPRLVIFSDGAFFNPDEIELPMEVDYQKIGSQVPNVAITGLDIRRAIEDRNKIEMFVAIQNFSSETFSGNIKVYLDEELLDAKFASIGPDETLSQIFEAILPGGGSIKVEFAVDDALACDNSAWRVVRERAQQKVLVVGDGTFFVERALKPICGLEYTTVSAGSYEAADADSYTTVIWNGVPNPGLANANSIYFGCFPPVAGLLASNKVDAPAVMDWDNTHPLNRFIDFNNLVIASARKMTLPEYAVPVLSSTESPLIGLLEHEGRLICFTAFHPMKSNWPLLTSFPLFMNNCLRFFDQRQAGRRDANLRVGDVVLITQPGQEPKIELPSGSMVDATKGVGEDYTFAGVDKAGVYRVVISEEEYYFVAANIFDHNESALTPQEEPQIGHKKVQASRALKQVNREYWRYLVLALAALLLVEWVVYHRRLFI